MSNGLIVSNVLSDSIAAEMEIEPGDIVLQVDHCIVEDILDLQYYTSEDEFTLTVRKKNNEIWELEIEKEQGEILGIEVCSVSVNGLKKCNNNCLFCFVKQMPSGMRESLYDRDDDYRLSVTQGSYITLSNLTQDELQRIIDFHISPLYISVHAWNSTARTKLMRNRRAGDLPEQIKMLANAGLTLHTQIVLVPDYNDGEVLKETVENLASYYPAVQSIGVVPVGLTKYRQGLPALRTVRTSEAQIILKSGVLWQKNCRKKTGRNLVYFSDELFVIAEQDFPDVVEYDDFPQIENGIGMAAKFMAEITHYSLYNPVKISNRNVHIITGVSAANLFRHWTRNFLAVQGLNITVHEVINNFFGSTVTVAGLLTAQDIAEQVGDLQGDYFLIPKVMLKADEEIFLDGYDISWVEKKVNGQALIIENNGKAFLEGILGRKLEVHEE